jgi:phosphatidylserine decarboxylase
MRIHPQGIIPILVILALLLLIVLFIQLLFPVLTIIHYILYGIGIIFFILVIRFFRHPARVININRDHVLSAADGKVVVIEEVDEQEYFHGKMMQISVFMSPLNVHVNWYPISGEVKRTIYFKGRNYPAYDPKASRENERMSVVIEKENGPAIMMVQIAGIMARRVFTNAEEGTYVFQGEEAGIIKFGSRVDLFLPISAKIKVKLGQQVRACETVIATLQHRA